MTDGGGGPRGVGCSKDSVKFEGFTCNIMKTDLKLSNSIPNFKIKLKLKLL